MSHILDASGGRTCRALLQACTSLNEDLKRRGQHLLFSVQAPDVHIGKLLREAASSCEGAPWHASLYYHHDLLAIDTDGNSRSSGCQERLVAAAFKATAAELGASGA
jgi:hypothetical protein